MRVTEVQVTRRPGDIVLQVVAPANRVIGYYCMYRGTREEMLHCLESVLAVVKVMPEQPIEQEDA